MGKWKPVALDNSVIFNDVEGLVGIEVLEDDNAPQVIHGKKKTVKRKKKNDRGVEKKKVKKGQDNSPLGENNSVENVRKIVEREKGSKKCKLDECDTLFLEEMKLWQPFGLRREILKALYDKGFLQPTKIQEKCVRGAMTNKHADLVGAAETGSGKTYAYGIPIVQTILSENEQLTAAQKDDKERDLLAAVIVTPTRELASQVKDHLTDLCRYTDINIAMVVGGLAKEKQERILKKRPEIVVGTPGRLWELYSEGNVHLRAIPRVRMLVVDEADRMLEAQHFAELGDLLQRMNDDPDFSSRRRNFVFSATLTFVHDPPSYHKGKKKRCKGKLQDLLARIGVKNQLVYDLSLSKLTPESLSERKITCEFIEKDYYLVHFLQDNPGRAIVFCNSIGCVRRLANLLGILKFKPLPLHANMEQKQRLKNLEKFRDNSSGLLLATDVAARGLDIPQVGHVIHYQVPRTAESYVHRSGRTARQSHQGITLMLVSVEEISLYKKLMKSLKRAHGVDELEVSVDDLAHVKKMVHLARDIDQVSLALKKATSTEKWYEKAIAELDIIVDDDERPKKPTDKAINKLKRELTTKQKELAVVMSKPARPRGFSSIFPDVNLPKPSKTVQKRKKKKDSSLAELM